MGLLSRRDVLRGAAAGAAGAVVLSRCATAEEAKDDGYGGFKMGMQSYSLRHFDLDGALARYKDLGLRYAEFYPGKQMKVTSDADTIKGYKAKLDAAGVAMPAFGVVGFGKDHEKNKTHFEFGKAMGVKTLTAYPEPSEECFESLAKLTKEYGITIAIHNHGPGDKWYAKIEQVQKAVEKWPEAIGSCVDTGHFIRSGEDPIKAIRAFGPRVHEVHLKDASGPNTFNILGEGWFKGKVADCLKALKEVKFDGCLAIEYEEKEQDPMDDIKQCLAVVRAAVKEL